MKKIILRVLAVLVALPIVLLLLGSLGYAAYAWLTLGQTEDATVTYLRQQQRAIPLGPTATLPDFGADFYDNQLFLLGESHGSAAPQELDFNLLRHLNQKTGLRNYVAEIDPSQAYFFNAYLTTGNEAHLRTVFQFWDGTAQWGNQDFYDKVKHIRALNQTLPAATRIRFIGLDRIQDLAVVGQHLRTLLRQEAYVAGTHPGLDSLLQLTTAPEPSEKQLARLAHRLLPTFGPDSVGTRLSGAGRAELALLLRNAAYLGAPRIRRDSVMLLNLEAAYTRLGLGQEKLYGLWGFHHVLQTAVNRRGPFAALANASALPCRGRVVSLATFLVDSETLIPAASIPAGMRPAERTVTVGWLNANGPVVLVPGVRNLLAAAPAPVPATLFRLDAPASPYRTSQQLARIVAPLFNQNIEPDQPGTPTTAYFQYAILLRGSAAVRPLVAQ